MTVDRTGFTSPQEQKLPEEEKKHPLKDATKPLDRAPLAVKQTSPKEHKRYKKTRSPGDSAPQAKAIMPNVDKLKKAGSPTLKSKIEKKEHAHHQKKEIRKRDSEPTSKEKLIIEQAYGIIAKPFSGFDEEQVALPGTEYMDFLSFDLDEELPSEPIENFENFEPTFFTDPITIPKLETKTESIDTSYTEKEVEPGSGFFDYIDLDELETDSDLQEEAKYTTESAFQPPENKANIEKEIPLTPITSGKENETPPLDATRESKESPSDVKPKFVRSISSKFIQKVESIESNIEHSIDNLVNDLRSGNTIILKRKKNQFDKVEPGKQEKTIRKALIGTNRIAFITPKKNENERDLILLPDDMEEHRAELEEFGRANISPTFNPRFVFVPQKLWNSILGQLASQMDNSSRRILENEKSKPYQIISKAFHSALIETIDRNRSSTKKKSNKNDDTEDAIKLEAFLKKRLYQQQTEKGYVKARAELIKENIWSAKEQRIETKEKSVERKKFELRKQNLSKLSQDQR